jgi:hypothetical protein
MQAQGARSRRLHIRTNPASRDRHWLQGKKRLLENLKRDTRTIGALAAMHVVQRNRPHAARNVNRAIDNYRLKTAVLSRL